MFTWQGRHGLYPTQLLALFYIGSLCEVCVKPVRSLALMWLAVLIYYYGMERGVPMDSFTVRVFQRDSQGEKPTFGTVQLEGRKDEVEFYSTEELGDILTLFRNPDTWKSAKNAASAEAT